MRKRPKGIRQLGNDVELSWFASMPSTFSIQQKSSCLIPGVTLASADSVSWMSRSDCRARLGGGLAGGMA